MSIFPFHQQKTVRTIAAHEGTLAAITFNASGSKLASASEKVSGSCVLTGSPPAGALWGGPCSAKDLMEQDRWVTGAHSKVISQEEILAHACYGILMPLINSFDQRPVLCKTQEILHKKTVVLL